VPETNAYAAGNRTLLNLDSTAKTLHLDGEADLFAAIALASWR
jgi:hypothetical protein